MGRERSRAWKYVYFCITGLIFLSLFSCATIKDIKTRKEAQKYLLRGQQLLAQRNFDGAIEEYQEVLSLSPQKPLQDEAIFNMGLVYTHFGNPKRNYERSLNLFMKILNDSPESPLLEQARIWVGVILENLETTKKFEKLKETIKDKEEKKETVERKETVKEVGKPKQQETRIEESKEGREHLIRSQKFFTQGNYEGAIGENQKVLSLPDPKSQKDEALFNLGLIYTHFGNPQRDPDKSLEFFKSLIKNYPKSSFVDQAKIWVGIIEENELLNQVIKKLKQVDIEIEEMRRKRTQ